VGLLLVIVSAGKAQVTVNLDQQGGEGISLRQLWSLSIHNQGKEEVSLKLKGDIQRESRLVYSALTKSLRIPPGVTRLNLGNFPGIEQLNVDLISQKEPAEGLYRLCVSIISVEKQDKAESCRDVIVAGPRPPVLVFPFDDDKLDVNYPTFSWLPPAPIKPGQMVTYTLRMVEESPAGGKTGPEFFVQENIPVNSLAYPTAAPVFKQENTYYWQVEAYRGGLSLGKSEVWSFHFGKPRAKRASSAMRPFVELQNQVGAGFCFAREELRIRFDCPYNEDDLAKHIFIKDHEGKQLPFEKELVQKVGSNQFIIPLPPSQGLEDQQTYILEVIDHKGRKKVLRFKYLKS
jgi:hypothetical protein